MGSKIRVSPQVDIPIFEWDRNNSDRNFYNVVRCSHTRSALNAGAKRSGATCHFAMPQCCYLAEGAKRPSYTTNTINFDRISFDPCNSIKRFDLCPFDQKNSTYLQPPTKNSTLSESPENQTTPVHHHTDQSRLLFERLLESRIRALSEHEGRNSGRFCKNMAADVSEKKYAETSQAKNICRNVSYDKWGISGVCTLALTVAKTSSRYDQFAISAPARSLLLFELA